jgi:hypothetical protein
MVDSPIKRRRVLTGLATTGLAAIAGCNSDGSTSTATETPTASPTPTATPTTTPNQQALEHYTAAIDTLVQNKEQLDDWADNGFGGESQVLGDLRDQLSQARDDLDRAQDADSTGDLVAKIDQARLVANFQELNIAYYDVVETFNQLMGDAQTFAESEQPQRAADKWAEAGQVVDDARAVVDDMETIFDQMDLGVLDEPKLQYTGEAIDYIELGDRRTLDGGENYVSGHERLQLSFVKFDAGSSHYDNEEYAEARKEWESGRSLLEEALASFEAVVDNNHVPERFNQDSIAQIGVVERMIEAFDKFVEGAKEAEAGNVEQGDILVSEGLDIFGEIFG